MSILEKHPVAFIIGAELVKSPIQLIQVNSPVQEIILSMGPQQPIRVVRNFTFEMGTMINNRAEQVLATRPPSHAKLESLMDFIDKALADGVIEQGVLGTFTAVVLKLLTA